MPKLTKAVIKFRSQVLFPAAAGVMAWGACTTPSKGATTHVWNNTTSTWETSSAWTPGGAPGSTDTASFDPTIAATMVSEPVISGVDLSKLLALNNDPFGGDYTISGSGTYNIGSGGITVRGYGTETISGPVILNGSSGVTVNIGVGGGLTVSGNTTITNNGNLFVYGGTLTLDNSVNNISRLGVNSAIAVGGGTFAVIGNTAGTTFNVPGIYTGGSYNTPGVDTFSVTQPTNASGITILNFGNSTQLTAPLTSTVYNFVGVGGTLGSAAGPQIKISTTPALYTSASSGIGVGLLKTGSEPGQAIVSDGSGSGWATYGTNGIQIMPSSKTAVTASDLQSLTEADVADFNPIANVTVSGIPSTSTGQGTPTAGQAAVVTGTLRITPQSSGLVLDLANNTAILATEGIMLNGPYDFNISGGTIGGSATKYIYVTNPATTLLTSAVLAGPGDGLGGSGQTSTGNPLTYGGPGFLVLNGSSYQIGLTTNKRFNIDGGTIRGNATQLGGFSATGTNNSNAMALRGAF